MRPVQPFECAVEFHPGTLVFRLAGELDLASAADFRNVTRESGPAGFGRVILDLRELEFCDSSGLHAIVDLGHDLPEETLLELIPGPKQVTRLFEVAGLAEILTFVDPAAVDL